MELQVKLSRAELISACANYIEDKLLLNGPGWHFECDREYNLPHSIDFTITREESDASPIPTSD